MADPHALGDPTEDTQLDQAWSVATAEPDPDASGADGAPETLEEGAVEADVATALEGEWAVGRGAELVGRAKAWVASGQDIVLDCSGLERLDVAALQVLLAARRKSISNGHAFRLDAVPSYVAETIRLTGLSELLS